MSSIAMAADSTQSELMRRRKHKAKLARQSSEESRKHSVTRCSKPPKAKSKEVKVGCHVLIFLPEHDYVTFWSLLSQFHLSACL